MEAASRFRIAQMQLVEQLSQAQGNTPQTFPLETQYYDISDEDEDGELTPRIPQDSEDPQEVLNWDEVDTHDVVVDDVLQLLSSVLLLMRLSSLL